MQGLKIAPQIVPESRWRRCQLDLVGVTGEPWGVGAATYAVKLPLPAGASLQPLTVLRASPGFSFLIYEIWILVVKPFSHGCHANPMRQHLMKRASSNEVLMRESSGNRNRISDWGLEIIKSPSYPPFFLFFFLTAMKGETQGGEIPCPR